MKNVLKESFIITLGLRIWKALRIFVNQQIKESVIINFFFNKDEKSKNS